MWVVSSVRVKAMIFEPDIAPPNIETRSFRDANENGRKVGSLTSSKIWGCRLFRGSKSQPVRRIVVAEWQCWASPHPLASCCLSVETLAADVTRQIDFETER